MAITNTLKARLMTAAKTAANWATTTQIPLVGELCVEIDTLKIKIGNGIDTFANLEYINTFPKIWLDAVEKFKTSPTGTNDANGGPSIIFKAGNDFNADASDTTHKYIDIDINADHTITVKTKGIDEAIQAALSAAVPSVVGGNKITETVSGTTVTLDHDTTTVDTTPTASLNHGDTFSVYTSNDDYGHVTEKTTFTLPTIDNGTVTAEANKVVTGVTTTAGVVTSVDSVDYKDIAQGTVENGNHTTVSNTTNGIKIDHNDVGTATAKTPTTDGNVDWGGDIITEVDVDSYGHVGGVKTKTLPSNPVSAETDTTNQLMKSDGDNTTSPSGFTASNSTITTNGAGNTTTLPTVQAIIDYISNISDRAMHYKGTVNSYADLPTTDQVVGDVYVLTTADSTGPYEVGDYFIWNGTSWDVITGENQVENKAATIIDSATDIAVVDGTTITAKVDAGTTSTKGIVQLTDTYTSTDDTKAATGKAINAAIETLDATDKGALTVDATNKTISVKAVSQTEGVITDGTEKTIQIGEGLTVDNSTNNIIAVDFVDDIHYSTDETKVASAKQVWEECDKRNVQFLETGQIDNIIQSMDEADFIAQYAYGISWVPNTNTITAIGSDMNLKILPVHSTFRACVYDIMPQDTPIIVSDDNGNSITYNSKREFRYWLDDDDWTKTSTGSNSVLTGEPIANGSIGSGIAIYHSKFYGKTFKVGAYSAKPNDMAVVVSLIKYDDTWEEIKEGYVDFGKMQEVSGYARSFGNPDFSITNPSTTEMSVADINTWIQKQAGSTIPLTKSKINYSRQSALSLAIKSGAHIMSFEEYQWIFCWLPAIEFRTFKVDSDRYAWEANGGTTSDSLIIRPESGYDAGYPGIYSTNYTAIMNTCSYSCIPNGYTNELGTYTGWRKILFPSVSNTYDALCVARWRGFEIQRNIWTNLHGVNPVQTAVEGYCDVYTTKNRALWNNTIPLLSEDGTQLVDADNNTHSNIPRYQDAHTYTIKDDWKYKGCQHYEGNIQEFATNDDNVSCFAGTLGSDKFDYSYGTMISANPRWFIVGGHLVIASDGGPFCFDSDAPAGTAGGNVGFRCCWNIDEYESVMN